jgi:hypothetical protein
MKTMILATAAVLALGAGSAYADSEGGTVANSWFTNLPGVVAQAPVQQQVPSAVARNQAGGAPTAAFVTSHSSGTWLFQPYQGNG